MQIVEPDIERHLDATDDGGRHLVDLDSQPRDLLRHAANDP
jgi:hypothetical protein